MNNKKILVVAVLAVIVTMMVGYALFSETITINGTATAKGDFAITTTCQAGVTENGILEAYGFADVFTEGGYSNDTCSVNGNTVSMSVNLKYPGATRFFTISMKNTGSIDAAVVANVNGSHVVNSASIEMRKNSDNSLFKSFTVSNWDDSYNALTNEEEAYAEEFSFFSGMVVPAIKTSTGEIFVEGSDEWNAREYDATTKDNDDDIYVKLEPEDTLIFIIPAYWSLDSTTNGYSVKVIATGEQKFKQMTSDMFLNTGHGTCYTGC